MPAYVIVDVDTDRPEEYEEYKRMAQQVVADYGGRYLVRGGRMRIAEGAWKPTRIVILQFDSYERAIEWWESPDYAPAKALRQKLANSDLVIVDGYADGAGSAG